MNEQITPNPSVPSQVVAEVTFPKFINNLGIIPTSYKDSMSYYECLAWLCKYLEETVIPSVNQNGNAVQELQNLYVELNSYVTNYFDNLDVQEEINHKLDQMAENGSLTLLIKNYVDPIYSAYETRINTEIDTIQNEVSSIASGSPAGVYSTVSDLESDDPDHTKIYLVTADGKWYYYNEGTSLWTEGGTYQSTGIGENEINTINLSENLQYSLNTFIPDITYTENKYITNSGAIVNQNNFNITNGLHLNIGDKIEFTAKGYSTSVSLLSEYTFKSNYTPIIISSDNNEHTFVYTALTEGDYYISSHQYPKNITIYRKNISTQETKNNYHIEDYIDNIIFNKIADDELIISDKYITASGNVYDQNNYSVTDYIEVISNRYITIKSNNTKLAYANNSVGIAEYNTNKQYITGSSYTNTSNYLKIKLNANTKYIRFTITPEMKTGGYNTYYSSISNDLDNLQTDINNLKKKKVSNNILCMFSNITCIGDSLTYSQVYTAENTYRQAYKTYPDIVGILSGATMTNLSHGGDTASQAWERWKNSIEQKTNQLTLIYLGTNDGLTDTVDTDCVGDDYNDYANTNTGNYGKIIQKSLDEGSKVILIKCYAPAATVASTNEVIEKLGTRFSVPVVENEKLTDDLYHYYPDLTGTNGVHYNDLGYEVFTENLINNINNLTDTDKSTLIPT